MDVAGRFGFVDIETIRKAGAAAARCPYPASPSESAPNILRGRFFWDLVCTDGNSERLGLGHLGR
jgi:hypothetical protein